MKTKAVWSNEEQCHSFVISDFSVELGNNFDYDMLMREIYRNDSVRDFVSECACIDDDITFHCEGLYGPIVEETCGSDVFDHFRAYDKEVERGCMA